ncbi:hypothetical protein CLHOM_15650 [Clostridium homopropionicum DSM 5847]|uniref:Uncharacterized protein n=1 Tax=Clostridium homopropionicum DSM 5847 TaxID=1121318 RepID=A0A0L6ZAK1_9CLOT|nr:hypothetical protein [Clostridium homopropionicum]KOA20000.1 hypothetical protein CLHOM_15650 [Clostridium homopropionicum DSM 5847]SFG64384.1 hypothetical protein SAMN04488501_11239 [Clostridium homopropionicum]
MLKLATIEFFFRVIPEMMIFMWGVYVISREKFKLKNYIFATLILAAITFGVRELPIHYGVHTILNNVLTICILIVIGIPIIKGVYSTLVLTLLLLASEMLNYLLLSIFKINIEVQLSNIEMKLILYTPSLIILTIFIYFINKLLKKREGIDSVSNGKSS